MVEALVQLGIHRRLSSRFPVHVSGLALAVPAVLGALPVGAVLTPIPERDQQNLQTQDPEPGAEPGRLGETEGSRDIDWLMSLPVCGSAGQNHRRCFCQLLVLWWAELHADLRGPEAAKLTLLLGGAHQTKSSSERPESPSDSF